MAVYYILHCEEMSAVRFLPHFLDKRCILQQKCPKKLIESCLYLDGITYTHTERQLHSVTDGKTDRRTDRQTDDIMMPRADHAACSTIG